MVNYAPRPGRSQVRLSAQAAGADQTLFGRADTLREAATFTLRRGRSQQAETQTATSMAVSQPDAGRDIISDMRRLNDDMARSIQCGVEQSLTACTRRLMIQNDKSMDMVNRVEQQLQLTNAQVIDMRKEWTKMERRINLDMRELRQEQVLLMETLKTCCSLKDARQDQTQSVKSVVRQEVEKMTDTWRRRQDQTLATVLGQVQSISSKVDENMTFTSGNIANNS